MQGDFKYFKTNEELETQLEGEWIACISIFMKCFLLELGNDPVGEQDNLLSFTKEYFPKCSEKNVELKEVTFGEGSSRLNNSQNSS